MKVSTDSLLLGSFTQPDNAKRILDVGTGSGILALMMAQKSVPECRICAIDIEPDAVAQASENAACSPWPDKITVARSALQALPDTLIFDRVIANPPYFHEAASVTRAYDGMTGTRSTARIDSGLSMDSFFANVAALTAADAKLNCMYPFPRHFEVLETALQHGWHVHRHLMISHNATITPYICLYEFTKSPKKDTQAKDEVKKDTQHLVIRDADNRYSQNFKVLCRDFYLKF